MVFVARPGTLDESDGLRRFAVRGPQDLPLGRTGEGREAFHHHVGDDVGIGAKAVGIELGSVIGLPPRCPDDGAHGQFEGLRFHVQIDGVVRTGFLDFLSLFALYQGGVEDIAQRERHVVRQIGGFDLVHVVVERVVNFHRAGLAAFVAAGALLVDVARIEGDGNIPVPFTAGNGRHLGQSENADLGAVLDAPEVDLQTAGRRTQLRKILMKLSHPSSEVGVLFHEIDFVARFCCFDGGRESTHAAADHQNTLRYCLCHACPPKLNEEISRTPPLP